MNKLIFLLCLTIINCGPSEAEIQNRIDEALNEATSTTLAAKTSTTSTTTLAPTTTSLKRELEVTVSCFNTESKQTSATISVSVINPTSDLYGFNVKITPGYDENFYIGRVEKGLRKTMSLEYEYDPQQSSISGKNYFTAKIYSIFTIDSLSGETTENLVGLCNFDRNYKDGQTSPNLTQPTTTTVAPTTTTTTVAPTTTTTNIYNYNKNTHQYINFSNLINKPPNPYLCEIPKTGIRQFYNWGRCLSFYGGVFPDFENSITQIWYDGEIYTTEDPYPVCYWEGEVEDCNVVRRLKAKQDIDLTNDLINDSINNMPP